MGNPPFTLSLLSFTSSLKAVVNCEGNSISGVEVVLLSQQSLPGIVCTPPSAAALIHIENHTLKVSIAIIHQLSNFMSAPQPICAAISDGNGNAYFKSIPSGNYVLSAVYIGDGTVFDVLPKVGEMIVSI